MLHPVRLLYSCCTAQCPHCPALLLGNWFSVWQSESLQGQSLVLGKLSMAPRLLEVRNVHVETHHQPECGWLWSADKLPISPEPRKWQLVSQWLCTHALQWLRIRAGRNGNLCDILFDYCDFHYLYCDRNSNWVSRNYFRLQYKIRTVCRIPCTVSVCELFYQKLDLLKIGLNQSPAQSESCILSALSGALSSSFEHSRLQSEYWANEPKEDRSRILNCKARSLTALAMHTGT